MRYNQIRNSNANAKQRNKRYLDILKNGYTPSSQHCYTDSATHNVVFAYGEDFPPPLTDNKQTQPTTRQPTRRYIQQRNVYLYIIRNNLYTVFHTTVLNTDNAKNVSIGNKKFLLVINDNKQIRFTHHVNYSKLLTH